MAYRLTDGPKVGDAPLKIQSADVVELNRALAQAQARILKYEEDEASACPEDVGFVEMIRTQRKRIEQLEAALRKAKQIVTEANVRVNRGAGYWACIDLEKLFSDAALARERIAGEGNG